MNRTAKYLIAGGVGLTVLTAETYQSFIDPSQDLGIDTFVLNSTATAGPANGVMVQDAVTGKEVVATFECGVKITSG